MAGRYDDIVPMPLRSGDGSNDGRIATASLLHGNGSSAPIADGTDGGRSTAPPRATFEMERFGGGADADADEDDDDLLLEWDTRAARRWQLCGLDCTWAMRFVPERFHAPPDWWFRLGRRQRLAVLYGAALAVAALLAAVVIGLPAAAAALTRGGAGSGKSSSSRAVSGGGSGSGSAGLWPRMPIRVDAGSSPFCAWDALQLPGVIAPESYELELAADPRAPERGVNGSVRVRLKAVAQPTPCVVLHAAGGVNITSVRLVVTAADDDYDSDSGGSSSSDNSSSSTNSSSSSSTNSSSSSSTSGSGKKRSDVIVGRVARATAYEQVILEFPEAVPLAPYAATLELAFNYPLREALDGLYLSRYTDADGANRTMASTHFEALAARRAFPCFDEPALKAAFRVRVAAPPPPWAVLSNMPRVEGAGGGGGRRRRLGGGDPAKPAAAAAAGGNKGDLVTYEFQRSPPMSTYLVAVVIGELEAKRLTCEAGAAKALPVAAWATPERAGQLGTALDAACASLRAFEAALGVPYPLPKLDLVGVPNFQAGAMENWGLIIYREARMLVDPSEGDAAQELRIGTIVAHEAAHQWFGDLVTLSAWEELWLNEGFASYFEYVGADAFRPDAKYFGFFWPDTASDGLEADADGASHPLSDAPGSITRLDGVDNRFDGVSYSKGAAVLRMLRAYLNNGAPGGGGGGAGNNKAAPGLPLADASGAQRMRKLAGAGGKDSEGGNASGGRDPFMRGLSAYLEAKAHGAATHADVWGAIGAAAALPVPDWMATWTLRRGFPVLSVDAPPPAGKADAKAQAAAGGGAGGGLRLSQLPFHAPRSFEVGTPYTADMYCNDWSDDPGDSSWWLPVAYYGPGDAPGAPPRWHAFNTCDSALPITLPKSAGGGGPAAAAAPLVIANAGRTGFYRVNYSAPLWDALIAAAAADGGGASAGSKASPPRVAAIDLAGAIDDAHALMMARQLDGTVFLRLIAALGRRRAPDYAPWSAALGALRRLHGVLSTAGLRNTTWDACAASLRSFVTANVTGPFLRGAAMPNAAAPGITLAVDAAAPLEARLLRPLALAGAGELGLKRVAEAARAELAAGRPLHPDVRGAAYKLAVLSGDGDAFERVLEMYRAERAPPVKAELLSALARAPTPALADRALQLALSPDVRTQDVGPLVAGVGAAGGAAFDATWRFVYARADALIARFAGGGSMYALGRRLNDLAPLFVDDAALDAATDFAAKRPGVLSPTFLDSARAALQVNQAWLLKQGPAVCGWLKDAAPSGDGGGSGGGGDSDEGGSDEGDDDAKPSEPVDFDDEEPDALDDDDEG